MNTNNNSRNDRRQLLVNSYAGRISFYSSCRNVKICLGRIKKECRRLTVWVTVCLLSLSSSWIPTALRDTGFRLRVLHYRNYPSAHFSPAFFEVHTPDKPPAGLATCSQPSLAPSHSYCARSQSHPLFLSLLHTHMRKLHFSNCCGQLIDFPFVFGCLCLCHSADSGGSLMTHCYLKGKLPSTPNVVDSDSMHAAMATDFRPAWS